jgi:hypothetical protein
MHFPNTTAAISSLLMVTASASTEVSFPVPGTGSATAVVPGAPEGDLTTTTVYETSTFYVTSAITVPTPVASVSESISAPANSGVAAPSSGYAMPPVPANSSATVPPAEITPTQSLYVIDSQTFVPVTLWENSTTRVIYPQNSTAPSTVIVTTSVASKTAVTTSKHSSATESPSATVSEVPLNGAGKGAGNAVLGMGLIAGFMALL